MGVAFILLLMEHSYRSYTFKLHSTYVFFSPEWQTTACIHHWKNKWSHFDQKIWVTGGTKIRESNCRFDSQFRVNLTQIFSNYSEYWVEFYLVPSVTQIFRSKFSRNPHFLLQRFSCKMFLWYGFPTLASYGYRACTRGTCTPLASCPTGAGNCFGTPWGQGWTKRFGCWLGGWVARTESPGCG